MDGCWTVWSRVEGRNCGSMRWRGGEEEGEGGGTRAGTDGCGDNVGNSPMLMNRNSTLLLVDQSIVMRAGVHARVSTS